MNITFEQLKERIDKKASMSVNTDRAIDKIIELLICLLDFEIINCETYHKAMNYLRSNMSSNEW